MEDVIPETPDATDVTDRTTVAATRAMHCNPIYNDDLDPNPGPAVLVHDRYRDSSSPTPS